MQDVEIPMDDGTVLRANLTLPALADGSQAPDASRRRRADLLNKDLFSGPDEPSATRGTAMFMCSST
jgi:hypothetical protein